MWRERPDHVVGCRVLESRSRGMWCEVLLLEAETSGRGVGLVVGTAIILGVCEEDRPKWTFFGVELM